MIITLSITFRNQKEKLKNDLGGSTLSKKKMICKELKKISN